MTARFATGSRRRRGDALEARLIFGLSFPICLAAAFVSRLAPRRPQETKRLSLVAQARAAASACSSFAFMG